MNIQMLFDAMSPVERAMMRDLLLEWVPEAPLPLVLSEIQLLAKYETIRAIKAVRERVQCSLMQAKDACDWYRDWIAYVDAGRLPAPKPR